MNDRFKILDDDVFWNNFMFLLSGYFSKSEDNDLKSLWIDGFYPLNCYNTKFGIEVEGEVSIMVGQEEVHKFRFTLEVPQIFLHKKIDDFKFEVTHLDFNEKKLELKLKK